MNKQQNALVALAILVLLTACGQSGPLYIPGNPSTVQAPAGEPPAEDEDDEDNAP